MQGDEGRVPESVAAAAYRLVQESVTNARRHARRASRIDVTVRAGDDAVTVEVVDDGERATVRGDVGFGIAGMVERAEGLGGTCVAGPRAGGGWAVTAVLPLRGAPA
jgi:signal transduction histidine kinase